jgi:hypothetical protein
MFTLNSSSVKVKDKVIPVLNYVIKCYKGIWGSGDTVPLFLTLPIDGGQWLVSPPVTLPSGIEPPLPI